MAEPFKQYKRNTRAQQAEERFSLGMNCTKAPLTEGFSRYLVNFDFPDTGEVLTPRPGIRANLVGLHPKHLLSTTAPVAYADEMFLVAGKLCSERDNQQYRQVITGQVSDTLITGTNLYKGKAYVSTVYPVGETYEELSALPPLAVGAVDSVEMHTATLAGNLTTAYTTFKRPKTAEIHGLSVQDTDNVAEHVGCFGFNNSYYNFLLGGASDKFMQTKMIETSAGSGRWRYQTEEVVPKTLNPKEAVSWGYNMLQTNPYTFTNGAYVGAIQLLGILPYNAAGTLIMTPTRNQELVLKCYYQAPAASYKFVWEWKEPAASTWIKLKEETVSLTPLPSIECNFSAPLKDIMVRVTATVDGETEPEKVMTVGFNFDKSRYGSTANVALKNFDLHKAGGMTYWRNRLVLWGLEEKNVLQMSEVNDPSYFPYPQGADILDEPIVYATPFLDNLLVFTSTKLYMLTLNMDGLTWTRKVIQNNLSINEWDLHLIKTVKNMVFFKSGNYYYMVVPSRNSMTGDLVLAPISKPIQGFFDDFPAQSADLINTVYDYNRELKLVHYYNFLDFEDVHNVYVFLTDTGLYINLVLLYNTISRSWRIYTYESETVYTPFKQDATKKGILMGLTPLAQTWVDRAAAVQTGTLPGLQFFSYDNQTAQDWYFPASSQVHTDTAEHLIADTLALQTAFIAQHIYKNFQFLDTGYRDHQTNLKKRYREVQFNINNIDQQNLYFYTDFYIDGDERRTMVNYTMHHETDPANPNYGLLTMSRSLADPSIVSGATALGENALDINAWSLDVSAFPGRALWKVRIPISGKGYTPRLRLVSYNEQRYELMNTLWVSRLLNSR